MGIIGGSDDDFSCCENAQRFVNSLACVCRAHHLYERREYVFMVLWEYTIIFPARGACLYGLNLVRSMFLSAISYVNANFTLFFF